MTPSAHQTDRRKQSDMPMSDEKFKEWTVKSLEEGTKQFEVVDTKVQSVDAKVQNVDARVRNVDSKVDKLTEEIAKLAIHIEGFVGSLAVNTELTKQTAELAQQTAADTADLVRIAQFGKKMSRWGRFTAAVVSRWGRLTAAAITFITRAASKLSKLLIPIFIVYAIASALWHGEPIRWKDVLEVIK